MTDVLCFVMGILDVIVGITLLVTFHNALFMIIGIVMLAKGGISFLG
jgi:hypothetical protein